MKAFQYTAIGKPPEVVEIPKPTAGPGQIVLKVTAAGVCHSDELVLGMPAEQYSFGLPLTLGHEGAGIVHELGEGVEHLQIGDAVAVYGPWGCGRCHMCAEGKENYCVNAEAEHIHAPGLGNPGSMAEYMLIDNPRHLVSLGDLDPVKNVSLTDAGLTPYHAIKKSLPKLGAGTTVVVIGAGGLGHIGIQILKALSGATVIALDVNDEKLDLAKHVGADHVLLSNKDAVEGIMALTDGRGADAIFDFVGIQPTVDIATAATGVEGEITIVGIGGGIASVGLGATRFDVSVRSPYWGSRSELIEVIDMARRGQIEVEIEQYSLDDAPKAYERLASGKIRGRAVILPNG